MQGIDLFSGAGGMSTGAESCGVNVRYAVESDRDAAATFALNHKNTTLIKRDIRSVKGSHFTSIDRSQPVLLFGGPPCQGFSTSNQRNRGADNENNWLFRQYLRLVREVRPDWVVFENVKGLLETEGGFFLEAVLRGFKDVGYSATRFVLNSADYGVPQKRYRLFIVGSLHGIEVDAPKPTSVTERVTVAQAFDDLPELDNGDAPDEAKYSIPARTQYAKRLRGALGKCHNNLVTNNAPHIIKRYSYIPQGGNWENIPNSPW